VAPGPRFEARFLSPGRNRRAGRRLPVIGGALLLVALGIALGRLSAPGRDETAAESAASSSSPSPALSAARPARGARPLTAHTRDGAARAAARALSSLADPRLLTSRRARRTAVAQIAPPTYRAELDPLFDRTYDYLVGILGTSARRREVVLRTTPLGYRVEAYSTRQATVAIWQVTLLATPERAPIAAWSTSRAELAWSGGRWRVERFGTDAPGPAPSVTAPATTAPPSDFVAAAQGFSPFGP